VNLEGFEIENWGCIRRLCVSDLPAASVVVLHGPNGTGKTSIVEALRACLMDNKSTSTALGRGLPKLSTDKPRVSVTFRAQGGVWRITKKFGSKESTLESRTPTGQWKLETSDATEAHDRTVGLVGTGNSSRGLQQLLWLTQEEFRLPKPKAFDEDVQSRLRRVLGVLQTPLDDRVHQRIQERWSEWFNRHGRNGEPKLKSAAPLAHKMDELQEKQSELEQAETEFRRFEALAQRAGELEQQERDFARDLKGYQQVQGQLQSEYEQSLIRLQGYHRALDALQAARKALQEAEERRTARDRAEAELADAASAHSVAQQESLDAQKRLRTAEARRDRLQHELQTIDQTGRQLLKRREAARTRKDCLVLAAKIQAARAAIADAEQLVAMCEALRKESADHPAPDEVQLQSLSQNRMRADRLRAELSAAAMKLSALPQPGAPPLTVAVDGAAAIHLPPTAESAASIAVPRRAQIDVPNWGRLEIVRGSDVRSLDAIEGDLARLNQEFAEQVMPFGVNPADPDALDQLRRLSAQKVARDATLLHKQQELDRLAPHGLERLREDVAKDVNKLQSLTDTQISATDLPESEAGLEREIRELTNSIEQAEDDANRQQRELDDIITKIEGTAEQVVSTNGRRNEKADHQLSGLRHCAEAAKNEEVKQEERVRGLRQALERLPTEEQVLSDICAAKDAVEAAQRALHAAELTDTERTVEERLKSAKDATAQMDNQLQGIRREFHTIAGELRSAEGLHQRRTAIASRVEQLQQEIARERLEADAHNRLLELFDECREKQLGTVMQPIHDRVVRWLQLLRIGNYDGVRFNDNFLPETLVAGGGALELPMEDESTGTIEQLGLMVRLALGATLSSAEEPAVAVLDDPLTHSDRNRLMQMRGVLRSAAAGDLSSTPPAGPLQVIVFTCHPEWFAIDGATVIDLGNASILQKG